MEVTRLELFSVTIINIQDWARLGLQFLGSETVYSYIITYCIVFHSSYYLVFAGTSKIEKGINNLIKNGLRVPQTFLQRRPTNSQQSVQGHRGNSSKISHFLNG